MKNFSNSSNGYKFKIQNPQNSVLYYADKLLGSGGQGIVYSGKMILPNGHERQVAIKVIEEKSDFGRASHAWLREIGTAKLNHPNILPIYDWFYATQKLIIVMEKATGSLEDILKNGPSPKKLVADIGVQIFRALDYVHKVGIVHRDVTVKNVLFFNNRVFKLADFGISKDNVNPSDRLDTFTCCPYAQPPEALLQGYTTQQSDIYQMGLVMLSLLLGKIPILPKNDQERQRLIMTGVPRQIAESLRKKHGELAEIITKMVCRTESIRYQTASEALEAIEATMFTLS